MKFNVQRKLNLANIDKDLWPYETEDLGVTDADSFEEAQAMVDRVVSERIGYYRAKSEEAKRSKISSPITPGPSQTTIPLPNSDPFTPPPPPPSVTSPTPPATGGMPSKFNV